MLTIWLSIVAYQQQLCPLEMVILYTAISYGYPDSLVCRHKMLQRPIENVIVQLILELCGYNIKLKLFKTTRHKNIPFQLVNHL